MWTPVDDAGTQIYLYGDKPADIAVQTSDTDAELRQLHAAFGQIDRLLDDYRGAKALREGVRAVVDGVLGCVASCVDAGISCQSDPRCPAFNEACRQGAPV